MIEYKSNEVKVKAKTDLQTITPNSLAVLVKRSRNAIQQELRLKYFTIAYAFKDENNNGLLLIVKDSKYTKYLQRIQNIDGKKTKN